MMLSTIFALVTIEGVQAAVHLHHGSTLQAQLPPLAHVGQAYHWTIDRDAFVSDPDDCLIQYDVANLPSWCQFDNHTLTFSGTPTTPNADQQSTLVTLSASAQDSAMTDTFALRAIRAPAPILDRPLAEQLPAISEALGPAHTLSDRSLWLPLGWSFSLGFDGSSFTVADDQTSVYWTAQIDHHRDLPSWLTFSSDSYTFFGVAPTTPARINVTVTASNEPGYGGVASSFEMVIAQHVLALSNPLLPQTNATAGTMLSSSVAMPDLTLDGNTTHPLNQSLAQLIQVQADTSSAPWLSFNPDRMLLSGTPPLELGMSSSSPAIVTVPIHLTLPELSATTTAEQSIHVYPSLLSTTSLPKVRATVGQPLEYDLGPYLAHQGTLNSDSNSSSVIHWAIEGGPSWLHADSLSNKLTGQVPPNGSACNSTMTLSASRIIDGYYNSTSMAPLGLIIVDSASSSPSASSSASQSDRLRLGLGLGLGLGIPVLVIILALCCYFYARRKRKQEGSGTNDEKTNFGFSPVPRGKLLKAALLGITVPHLTHHQPSANSCSSHSHRSTVSTALTWSHRLVSPLRPCRLVGSSMLSTLLRLLTPFTARSSDTNRRRGSDASFWQSSPRQPPLSFIDDSYDEPSRSPSSPMSPRTKHTVTPASTTALLASSFPRSTTPPDVLKVPTNTSNSSALTAMESVELKGLNAWDGLESFQPTALSPIHSVSDVFGTQSSSKSGPPILPMFAPQYPFHHNNASGPPRHVNSPEIEVVTVDHGSPVRQWDSSVNTKSTMFGPCPASTNAGHEHHNDGEAQQHSLNLSFNNGIGSTNVHGHRRHGTSSSLSSGVVLGSTDSTGLRNRLSNDLPSSSTLPALAFRLRQPSTDRQGNESMYSCLKAAQRSGGGDGEPLLNSPVLFNDPTSNNSGNSPRGDDEVRLKMPSPSLSANLGIEAHDRTNLFEGFDAVFSPARSSYVTHSDYSQDDSFFVPGPSRSSQPPTQWHSAPPSNPPDLGSTPHLGTPLAERFGHTLDSPGRGVQDAAIQPPLVLLDVQADGWGLDPSSDRGPITANEPSQSPPSTEPLSRHARNTALSFPLPPPPNFPPLAMQQGKGTSGTTCRFQVRLLSSASLLPSIVQDDDRRTHHVPVLNDPGSEEHLTWPSWLHWLNWDDSTHEFSGLVPVDLYAVARIPLAILAVHPRDPSPPVTTTIRAATTPRATSATVTPSTTTSTPTPLSVNGGSDEDHSIVPNRAEDDGSGDHASTTSAVELDVHSVESSFPAQRLSGSGTGYAVLARIMLELQPKQHERIQRPRKITQPWL